MDPLSDHDAALEASIRLKQRKREPLTAEERAFFARAPGAREIPASVFLARMAAAGGPTPAASVVSPPSPPPPAPIDRRSGHNAGARPAPDPS